MTQRSNQRGLAPVLHTKISSAARSAALLADERSCFLAQLAAAIVGAGLITAWTAGGGDPGERVVLRGLTFLAGVMALGPRLPWGGVLRNSSLITMAGTGSALAAVVVTVGAALNAWPAVEAPALLAACAGASAAAAITLAALRGARNACAPVRLAVVGSAAAAAEIATDLVQHRPRRYEVIGCVAGISRGHDASSAIPVLGTIDEMPDLIASHKLELLVLTPGISRLAYYDELVDSCLISGIRTADLDHFYERAFGHVPVGSINSCWFHHLVTMDRGRELTVLRRALDLASVVVLGMLTMPLLALLTFLIRRDGGPALFRQPRIGEAGRPFVILKLRTMSVRDDDEARWAAEHDPRITRIGRILRATHLDELPQLLNVLRGEMHIVGPRPEQTALVERLEAVVPYYQRRHLVKPGVAGWAQARCGYAGSDDGSLRKVCHDLYYLRHRSIRFDLAILAETLFATLGWDGGAGLMAGRAERVLRRGRQRLEQADVLTELAAPTHEAALESDLGSVALGPLKVSRRPADSD